MKPSRRKIPIHVTSEYFRATAGCVAKGCWLLTNLGRVGGRTAAQRFACRSDHVCLCCHAGDSLSIRPGNASKGSAGLWSTGGNSTYTPARRRERNGIVVSQRWPSAGYVLENDPLDVVVVLGVAKVAPLEARPGEVDPAVLEKSRLVLAIANPVARRSPHARAVLEGTEAVQMGRDDKRARLADIERLRVRAPLGLRQFEPRGRHVAAHQVQPDCFWQRRPQGRPRERHSSPRAVLLRLVGQPALDQLRCELYIQGPNRTRGSGSSADVPEHLGRVPPAEAMRRSLLGILWFENGDAQ